MPTNGKAMLNCFEKLLAKFTIICAIINRTVIPTAVLGYFLQWKFFAAVVNWML